MTRVRIATRGSDLALFQARYVAARIEDPSVIKQSWIISNTGLNRHHRCRFPSGHRPKTPI